MIVGVKNGGIPMGFKGFVKEPLNTKANNANNANANTNDREK